MFTVFCLYHPVNPLSVCQMTLSKSSLQFLLNSEDSEPSSTLPPVVSAWEELQYLKEYASATQNFDVPASIHSALISVVEYLRSLPVATGQEQGDSNPPAARVGASCSPGRPMPLPTAPSETPPQQTAPFVGQGAVAADIVEYNVKLNRKTTLVKLYTFKNSAVRVEYPETNEGWIGYKFKQDPASWQNHVLDIAYSLYGNGQTTKEETRTCALLVSSTTGKEVPCIVSHSTCEFVPAFL